jgi:hypothetical protein
MLGLAFQWELDRRSSEGWIGGAVRVRSVELRGLDRCDSETQTITKSKAIQRTTYSILTHHTPVANRFVYLHLGVCCESEPFFLG